MDLFCIMETNSHKTVRVACKEHNSNMMRSLAVLLASLALASAATDQQKLRQTQARIKNPDAVPPASDDFPFFGLPESGFLCGAARVAPDMALTAATCEDFAVGQTIRFGGTTVGTGTATDGTPFTIVEIIPHPLYNNVTFENDLALLRLSGSSAEIADYISPDDLPIAGLLTAIGIGATGFTVATPPGPIFPVVLQQRSDLEVKDASDCLPAVFPDFNDDLMLCVDGAMNSGDGICEGDIGGPVMLADGTIVGVASQATSMCDGPQAVTRLSAYTTFLDVAICAKTELGITPAICPSLSTASPTATPVTPGTCNGPLSCQMYVILKVIAAVLGVGILAAISFKS